MMYQENQNMSILGFNVTNSMVFRSQKSIFSGSPEALLSSLWMNIHTFFEIKERGKHVSLVLGDILLKTTEDGLEYLELSGNNLNYHKNPKNLDSQKNCCNYPKIGTISFYYRVIGPKDADGMAQCRP